MDISRFISKTVPFKFRGMDFTFDLSQGLFSSAGVDAGTKLLLKVFSHILDENTSAKNPAIRVLDAGCGAGVIGICAASALAKLTEFNAAHIVCQDRDELARLVTLHNAAQNGIPPSQLEAYTEPLLAGPPGARWDMILTNIPAKAGAPVLEDFVRRSAALLNPGGRVIMAAVNTLADFFQRRIAAVAELWREERGTGHTVFVYGGHGRNNLNISTANGTNLYDNFPCVNDAWRHYARTKVTCPIEGIPIRLETIHGASGFDQPGDAVLATAKLIRNMGLQQFPVDSSVAILIHEPEQGFFPCWLLKFLRHEQPPVLSGRNILALQASRHNAGAGVIVPVADLQMGRKALLEAVNGRQYSFIAAFPQLLPQSPLPKGTDQLAILWDALPALLAGGGIFLAAFTSSDAERFDRKKPPGFTRLGSVKRHGFRALAYRYNK